MRDAFNVSEYSANDIDNHIEAFADLLHACVHGGASVNFIMPFDLADARAFWTNKVLPDVKAGSLVVLAAEENGRIAGSIQLNCATPPNQPHRADVKKVLVHPHFRRRGLARRLLTDIEIHARSRGRSLLTLDTRSGDKGEPLYLSCGYQAIGQIPGYSRDPFTDTYDAATFMYKHLPGIPA
jgi:GNAT superfamily N-acetyltransferase